MRKFWLFLLSNKSTSRDGSKAGASPAETGGEEGSSSLQKDFSSKSSPSLHSSSGQVHQLPVDDEVERKKEKKRKLTSVHSSSSVNRSSSLSSFVNNTGLFDNNIHPKSLRGMASGVSSSQQEVHHVRQSSRSSVVAGKDSESGASITAHLGSSSSPKSPGKILPSSDASAVSVKG